MAEYWRGDITLRKLRVLTEGLPQSGPHTKAATNGIEYSYTDSMLWILIWATWVNTVTTAKAAGDKKAKMPADKMPTYPWTKPEKSGGQGISGDLGDYDQDEVLDWLDNL
ncbi:hypothetical protein [Corynebacterium sp. CNJ-954]|uniref:hypothetical protein n=1 Tax=Corynebacterium sp. CNJ-954 TaxID=1904962 RepID=UPI00096AB783|nr:hypothetical protein [Corynebacterium sp. CNJ-954]